MKSKPSQVLSVFMIMLSILLTIGVTGTSGASFEAGYTIYLPLVMKNFPFTPAAPSLYPINNIDGDGAFTVSWSSSEGATMYKLEEDDNVAFSSPVSVYQGGTTAKAITGKTIGTFYYRVKAANNSAESAWSNIVAVQVTLAVSYCPQTGLWRGVTLQNESITFVVEDQPQCQIADDSLHISWQTTCGTGTTSSSVPLPIIDQSFSASGVDSSLEGTFISSTQAQGTFDVNYTVSTPYFKQCAASVTWDAHPLHGVSGSVEAVYVQADNKILLGGWFGYFNDTDQSYIARLHPDGSLDETFLPDVDYGVSVITQQSDGKILIGGYFSEVEGQARIGIARLNLDGSLDSSFNANLNYPNLYGTYPRVFAIEVLPDGDILIGGEFNEVNTIPHNYIARLNPDGTLDPAFNANFDYGYLNSLKTIAVSNGQIYAGGEFYVEKEVDGVWIERENLARLDLVSGSLDENFDPALQEVSAFDVRDLAVQPADGKIVVLQGVKVFRLLTSGVLDSIFIDFISGGPVTVKIKNNNRILVGGYFDDFLIEFLTDGSQNMDFDPGVNNSVLALAIQPDGKVVLGGEFIMVGGLPRDGIARINTDGQVDPSFDPGP